MTTPRNVEFSHPRCSGLVLRPLLWSSRPIDREPLWYDDLGCVWEYVHGAWREVDTFVLKSGYEHIRLEGGRIGPRLSRLILEAHAGPPPSGKPLCRHLNDRPLDNRPSNLAWGDHADNMADLRRNRPELFRWSDQTVLTARLFASVNNVESLVKLVKRNGSTGRTLWHVLTGSTWAHVGGPLASNDDANRLRRLVGRCVRQGGGRW